MAEEKEKGSGRRRRGEEKKGKWEEGRDRKEGERKVTVEICTVREKEGKREG